MNQNERGIVRTASQRRPVGSATVKSPLAGATFLLSLGYTSEARAIGFSCWPGAASVPYETVIHSEPVP